MSLDSQLSSNTEAWYLAASKPKQELRAVENLKNQGISAFTPVMQVEKIRAGKKRIVTEVMFTGYVFILLSPEDGLWHKVRSTRGIRDWVRFSGEAAKVPKEFVESMQAVENSEDERSVKKAYESGDLVSILTGPFAGLQGVFEASNGEERALILVDFLGKQNRIKLDNSEFSKL